MSKLKYFVYNEDGSGNIVKYNVLNDVFVEQYLKPLKKSYKKGLKNGEKEINLKKYFAEEFKNSLFYQYWGRAEYEVVVTTWPPFVEKSEIDNLASNKDGIKYRKTVNLSFAEKVSAYDQIMINFDVIVDYVLLSYILK